jgi:hypothetical protein
MAAKEEPNVGLFACQIGPSISDWFLYSAGQVYPFGFSILHAKSDQVHPVGFSVVASVIGSLRLRRGHCTVHQPTPDSRRL